MKTKTICFALMFYASVFADSSVYNVDVEVQKSSALLGLLCQINAANSDSETQVAKSGVAQSAAPVGEIWYVRKGAVATNNGLLPTTPFPELKNALDKLNGLASLPAGGVTIYITGGKYVPVGADYEDSTVDFVIDKPVRIVGGWENDFSVTSSSVKTTLSGDNGNNDGWCDCVEDCDCYPYKVETGIIPGIYGTTTYISGIYGTNAYHVVSIAANGGRVTLECLTIEGGSAITALNSDEDRGGGVYVNDANKCDIEIKDCVIQYNRAVFGGGIYKPQSSNYYIRPVLSH